MSGGQQINSGQGTLLGGPGADVAGQESTAGQGSVNSLGTSVRLHSRKVGGGTAQNALSGIASALMVGFAGANPVVALTGVASQVSHGSFAKQRSATVSGIASTTGHGNVVAPIGSTFTTLTMSSATTGADLPFTVGHAFKDGDVPAGASVTATGTSAFHCFPIAYWPSGALKFGICSGVATWVSAGNLTFSLASGVASGSDITEAALIAAAPSVVVDVGGVAISLTSLLGSPHRTVCTGPAMSNWLYRAPVTGSNHLVVWLDVRLYVGGRIEVFPYLENGYLTVTGPTNWVGTVTVTISGATVYSQTIDVKHHTRPALVTGQTYSYWIGGDPQIIPKHNTAYMMASKVVGNYASVPTTAVLDAQIQSYTHGTLAGVSSSMDTAGGSGALLWRTHVFYLTSGADARAYRATMVHGLSSGGSWSIHYRDELTNEPPTLTRINGITALPSNSGGTWGTWGTSAVTHQPCFGYFPFLLTGRWYFWEESAFWCAYNFMVPTSAQRWGTDGIYDTANGSYAIRGAAWALRTLAQTINLCPTSHPIFSEYKAAWENNALYYRTKYVDGGTYKTASFGTSWISPQGFLGEYAANGTSPHPNGGLNYWNGSAYMNNYHVEVWGWTSDLGLPISTTARDNHIAVRNQAYKQVVARSGDGTEYNWRRFVVFQYPCGEDQSGLPLDTWYTPAQSYAKYREHWSLADVPATPGLSLLAHLSDSDITSASSALEYGSSALSGLGMAVDHGATGAAEGYLRVTGASNYALFPEYWKGVPAHSYVPRNPPSTLPAWVSALPLFQWYSIPNSTFASHPDAPPGSDAQGMFAYCGAALKKVGSELFFTGGGHADGWRNEVWSIVLNADAPALVRRRASTPFSEIGWGQSDTGAPHYSDGRPASRHTYWHIQFNDQKNLLMFHGAAAVYGNGLGSFNVVDAFDPTTNDYLPAGTFSNLAVQHTGTPTCKDGLGNVWQHSAFSSNILKWSPSAATNGAPGTSVTITGKGSTAIEMPYCVDTTRNVMLRCGFVSPSFSAAWYDLDAAAAVTTITLAGDSALVALARTRGSMVYDPANDCFWRWPSLDTPRLLKIAITGTKPSLTFTVTEQAMSGTVTNTSASGFQSYGRFSYVPELKGIVWWDRHTNPIRFMRTAL